MNKKEKKQLLKDIHKMAFEQIDCYKKERTDDLDSDFRKFYDGAIHGIEDFAGDLEVFLFPDKQQEKLRQIVEETEREAEEYNKQNLTK